MSWHSLDKLTGFQNLVDIIVGSVVKCRLSLQESSQSRRLPEDVVQSLGKGSREA